MKPHTQYLIIYFIFCCATTSFAKGTDFAGFFMPDSVNEVTIRYKKIQNLIILPVVINDSIKLNLVLDTGCRNLILFGKKLTKLFNMHPTKMVEFSGLGAGRAVSGRISLGNKVSIGAVLGKHIPIVVVPNQNLFGVYPNVDGIIGYDVFIKFEIEFSHTLQSIIFRPAMNAELDESFTKIPITVHDSKAMVKSTIFFEGQDAYTLNLVIDTGSSLGLLVKTMDHSLFPVKGGLSVLGRGLNGLVEGFQADTRKILLDDVEILGSQTGIMYSPWPDQGSIGMAVLGKYCFVLNYCKGYIGLKRDVIAVNTRGHRTQKPRPVRYF
ncbi:MAG: retropepsin-like aspartic protease [Chryseolinea sp.]